MRRKLINRFGVALVAALSLFLFCSCCVNVDRPVSTKPYTNGGSEVKLTARQIEILAQVGLPTEYDRLTDNQKHDIAAIEDMLCYLEREYQGTATYVSFVQGGPLNDEELTAIVGGQKITVTRSYEDGRYVYKDDYASVNAVDEYEAAIQAFFDERGMEVKVYAENVTMLGNTGNLLADVSASVFVFISADSTDKTVQAIAEEYGQWYAQRLNGTAIDNRLYMVDAMDFLDVGRETYRICLQEVPKENCARCIISKTGSVTVK